MYGTFTLTGRNTTPSGRAHTGQVIVTANTTIRDTAGNVVMSGSEAVTLDETGAWSQVLPCDSPELNPSTGIGYRVGYELRAAAMMSQSFYATADLAGSTLDVSKIVSVSLPTPLSAIVGPAGDDAYEVAVANGYMGSRTDWLASLVGKPGAANSLAIGSVTTAPAGSSASASISGAAPNQTLSLTIPKGDKGDTAFAFDTDGTPFYGATATPSSRVVTEARQSSGFGLPAYNLKAAGLTDSTPNIRPLLDAAVATGARRIVIPYRAAAWPMTDTFTATGVTIEFEPGARVSLNMASGLAMDLTASTLVNASFTSPFTGLTGAADWPNYSLPARGISLGDDCRTEGRYYQEYAATGLLVVGARVRLNGNLVFNGMRHRSGWASSVHVDGTTANDMVCRGSVSVTNSDRAIEVESGASEITFLGGGKFVNVYPNGYTGQPIDATGPDGATYATYTFTVGAHSHAGEGSCSNIRFLGHWRMENCGAGIQFVRSSGTSDTDMPRDNYVESATIIGMTLAPGYQAVALQGYNNQVGRVHFQTGSGIAGSLLRVRGYGGANNVVKVVTADDATKNVIRVDGEEGGGLRAGDFTMPALKGINGKYLALSGPVNATNGALGNNTLRLIPHYIAVPLCIDRIGCEVTVAGDAGSVVRLAIYDDASGLPGSPIIDTTVPAGAIGTPVATVFTVLAPGWYWVGGAIQGAATTQPTLRSTGSVMTPGYPILADTAATAIQTSPIAHSKGGVSAALPAFGTVLSGTSAAPRVFVRLV